MPSLYHVMSLSVIACRLASVPRWEADARSRLEAAALALYEERGFEETTVEDIAERAGLTRRTFFRYFADKREVLFGGGETVEELFVRAVREAPKSASPLDAIAAGLDALATPLDAQSERTARRFRIVRASPQLWERQLIKFALLADAGASALRARGVGDRAAVLAAETGITLLRVASDRWLSLPKKKSLRRHIDDAMTELRSVVGRQEAAS